MAKIQKSGHDEACPSKYQSIVADGGTRFARLQRYLPTALHAVLRAGAQHCRRVIPMKMGIQIPWPSSGRQKNLELDSRLRGNDRSKNSRNRDFRISN